MLTVLGFVVGPDVPHLNAVLQPKMEVGGREVNKYECHLCQVECNSIDTFKI